MAGKAMIDADNLLQLCSDMLAVKEALIEVGAEIPDGTPSSRYGELIKELFTGAHKNNTKNIRSETTGLEDTE